MTESSDDDRLFDYFAQILDSGNVEALLGALLALERCCLTKDLSTIAKIKIKPKLERLAVYYDRNAVYLDVGSKFRPVEYQVGFCARWLLDNLVNDKLVSQLTELPVVKLLNDRLNARVDNNGTFSSVRSAQAILSENVYFYEVTLLTWGKVRIGFCTAESRLSNQFGIGADRYSIGFDPSDGSVWHNSEQFLSKKLSPMPSSFCSVQTSKQTNVIGCLIDTKIGLFVFYLNGNAVQRLTNNVHFSLQSYFAAVSLSTDQQCHFNFGQGFRNSKQQQFKYPPTNVRFKSFHTQSLRNPIRYQLLEACCLKDDKFQWFKREPIENCVDLFFCDDVQVQFDDQIEQINLKSDGEFLEFLDKMNFKYDTNFKYHRIVQSVILCLNIDSIETLNIFMGTITEKCYNFKEKLYELLYPYLHLRFTEENETVHRNICIILCYMIKFNRKYYAHALDEKFRGKIYAFLMRTFAATEDNRLIQFYVLICLGELEMSPEELRSIRHCIKLCTLFDTEIDRFEKNVYGNILSGKCSILDYKLYFVKEYLMKRVFNADQGACAELSNMTLNANDRTENLKLSQDLLSARSDDLNGQSVKSVHSARKFTETVYYETVLLSGGAMRIGWSTAHAQLDQIDVGEDEHSIGFDGYNQCVWHDGTKIKIPNGTSRWKEGDVIGCLIDRMKCKFKFYLNGSEIKFCTNQEPNYHFKKDFPYHASVTLSYQQQCYFNFGQDAFEFAPKSESYLNFHQIQQKNRIQSDEKREIIPTSSNMNETKEFYSFNALNSLITINSKAVTTGDVRAKCLQNGPNWDKMFDNENSIANVPEKSSTCSQHLH